MTTELSILSWTLVLALVQVLLPAVLRGRENRAGYNASARDQPAALLAPAEHEHGDHRHGEQPEAEEHQSLRPRAGGRWIADREQAQRPG